MSTGEEAAAIQETYEIIQEYGQAIELVQQTESGRSFDRFGSPKSVTESAIVDLTAFPIRFKPSRKEIRQAGFQEDVEVIMYIAKKELDDKLVIFDLLRDRIRHNDIQYKISEQSENGHFGTTFRSLILGLKKD